MGSQVNPLLLGSHLDSGFVLRSLFVRFPLGFQVFHEVIPISCDPALLTKTLARRVSELSYSKIPQEAQRQRRKKGAWELRIGCQGETD